MHNVPHPSMHGLHGYKEVIDSVQWGLEQLGHTAYYGLNDYNPNSNNIVFGAQVLPVSFLQQMPANTIVYNFEQYRGFAPHQIYEQVHFYAQHFQVWEYSAANMATWAQLQSGQLQSGQTGVAKPAKLVPVGYAPILSRIDKPAAQDIDVLIYGLAGGKRLDALSRLSQAGFKTMFLSGFYGAERDALIARSKIILNVNLYDYAQIFEVVRVSYLLANRKAVVATLDERTEVERDLQSAVRFTTMNQLVDECRLLLESEDARRALEQSGFQAFSKRDVVASLRQALAGVQLV
jgi:hypothetical protein